MEENIQIKQKAAFATLVGRPSVGKSTLINSLCGEKVSIVSPWPQTTRNAVRGIVNRPEGQIVFIDTPGRHISAKKFNRKLLEVSKRSIGDADVVVYLLDATRAPGAEESAVADYLTPFSEKLVVAINKMDIQSDVAKTLDFLKGRFLTLAQDRIFKISAAQNDGLNPLLKKIFDISPIGSPFYPTDCYTDQDVQFRIAEIIREKAVNRLRQELPHCIYVEIADAEFRDAETERKKLWVRAFIITERESQKGMVVGKGGQMVKAIRLAALKDLQSVFDWKIELDLRVKTANDWRTNDALLKRITD
ncbi:MAG: GTPase Era [Treponema sp.]|jgi:GTP-binding protein Era|nr:GTPase Era [Treponema sp.]